MHDDNAEHLFILKPSATTSQFTEVFSVCIYKDV